MLFLVRRKIPSLVTIYAIWWMIQDGFWKGLYRIGSLYTVGVVFL